MGITERVTSLQDYQPTGSDSKNMQQKGQMFNNYEKNLEHVVVHRKGFVAHISDAQSCQIAVQTYFTGDSFIKCCLYL